jgi:hypothetical protein
MKIEILNRFFSKWVVVPNNLFSVRFFMTVVWRSEQLAPDLFKVVEDDKYGQYPFLYVILGVDKCILVIL